MPDDLPASLCLRVHRIAPSFVEDKKRLHPKGGMLKLSGYEKEQTTTTIGKETMHLIQPFIMPVFKPVFKRVTQRKPRIAISNMKAEETIYC